MFLAGMSLIAHVPPMFLQMGHVLKMFPLEMGLRISKTHFWEHFSFILATHFKCSINVSVGYSAVKLTQTLKCSFNVPTHFWVPLPPVYYSGHWSTFRNGICQEYVLNRLDIPILFQLRKPSNYSMESSVEYVLYICCIMCDIWIDFTPGIIV